MTKDGFVGFLMVNHNGKNCAKNGFEIASSPLHFVPRLLAMTKEGFKRLTLLLSLRGATRACLPAGRPREGSDEAISDSLILKQTMISRNYYVYILTNKNHRVLYVGVTNNLARRILEHKHKLNQGFTSKYNVNRLVYFETGEDIGGAIAREKQIKGGSRLDKIKLINSENPEWQDLSEEWL